MIQVHDIATGTTRPFATGLRNPVGMAFTPEGALWTVVNERDGLGDETPPDYLTQVTEGGFYGWPYCYWGQIVDTRVPQSSPEAQALVAPRPAAGLRAWRPHRLAGPVLDARRHPARLPPMAW